MHFPSDARDADRGGEAVGADLDELVGIFGGDNARKRPALHGVAGGEAVRKTRCAVGPETASAAALQRPLAIGGGFQDYRNQAGVDHRFGSEAAGFGEMIVLREAPEEIKSAARAQSGVAGAEARDVIAHPKLRGASADLLLRLRVVMEGERGRSGERDEPESVFGVEMQRAGPDAELVARDIFQTEHNVRWTTERGFRVSGLNGVS